MRLRRGATLLTLVTALALVMAACGDDDAGTTTAAPETTTTTAAPDTTTTTAAPDTTTTTAAPETTTTTAAPLEPIKLMVIAELSAGIAVPEIAGGATAAVERINSEGGINGRMLELIICDTQNDPNTAAECGRQAVDEGVVAAVGSLSVHSGEYLPLFEENEIASIGQIPAAGLDFASPASFPIIGGAPTSTASLGGALADAGVTAMSAARVDIAQGAAIPQFVTAGIARYGLSPATDVPIPIGAPDMAVYVAAATANGETGAVVAAPGQDALNFAIAALQADPDFKIAMVTSEYTATIDALGDLANGIYFSQSVNRQDEGYLADMAAAGQDDVGGNASTAYASVLVFAAVAGMVDDVTASSIWATLPTVTGLDIGIMPPLQFVEGAKFPGIPRIFNNCAAVTQIQDGQLVTISGYRDVVTGQDC